MTILVSGMIAADPQQGGASWAVLQYLLGFRRLGHIVHFVEPVNAKAVRPDSIHANYFTQVMSNFGFQDHSALLCQDTRETVGRSYQQILEIGRRADVLLNISGMLADPAIIGRIPARVYLDLDPAFVQLWHAQGIDMRFAAHTHFVSVGRSLGLPECPVPTGERIWHPTFPPIVLDAWPVAPTIEHDAFTTIAHWRGYGSVEHAGTHYGQKAHSLRKFFELPMRSRERFALALAIHSGETSDLAALAANRWHLLDPAKVAHSPASYRDFVQGSKAEFGIAKSGYVASRCGWFSDRSACYLASGRPVLAQDTGFSQHLPTGVGLLAFSTLEEAVEGAEAIASGYARHRHAARAIAEEYFDSDRVLADILHWASGERQPSGSSSRKTSTDYLVEPNSPTGLRPPLAVEEIREAFPQPIASIAHRPSAYRTSFPLDEIDLTFADGTTLPLMLKRLAWDRLTETVRRAKPAFLHDPRREIETYHTILPNVQGPAHCYVFGHDWLLLERVAGLELYQIGDAAPWHAVARWLAAFHAQYAGHEPHPYLLKYDGDFYRQWPQRAVAFATHEQRPQMKSLAARYEPVIERLLALPKTVLHGEFYASNVLVSDARVCPIDWEMAARGPGLIDLAALTAGRWTDAERAAMVAAYGEVDAVAFDCCRLHLAMQWLGWAEQWTPPPEHAHDWLSEAMMLAGEVMIELIVNADDFGLSQGVNAGIITAHEHGIVTSTSLMVRQPAVAEAVAYAKQRPQLGVGLHVDLGEWAYRNGEWVCLYQVIPPNDDVALRTELAWQVETFEQVMGQPPTHLDSHQHVHQHGHVCIALTEAAESLGVPLRHITPMARYSGDFYGQDGKGRTYPAGISVETLLAIIAGLEPGLTEMACHPGYDDELDSMYRSERAVEVASLCDPRVRAVIHERGVRLRSFAR